MAYISAELRQSIAKRAGHRCEYCQSPELITGGPLHVEHIIPDALGGSTTPDNLAFACARCNLYKAVRIRYPDPVSRRLVPLFNPRTQKWSRHFFWNEDSSRIIGRTQSRRATIIALNMNHSLIVRARSLWAMLDIHPPND